MDDKSNMVGYYTIEARDAKTGDLIKQWKIKNLLTKINQTVRTQMLLGTYAGTVKDFEIKYLAIGTGSTTPAITDTKLANEVFRKQITQITNPSDGVVQTIVSIGSSEANYYIQEIGIFAGTSATAATNSGNLISRILFPFDKNSNIVLNIVRNDICTIN